MSQYNKTPYYVAAALMYAYIKHELLLYFRFVFVPLHVLKGLIIASLTCSVSFCVHEVATIRTSGNGCDCHS